MPYENTQILPPVEGESFDAPKKFTNIDKEDFEFTWDNIKYTVKAGETVTLPKYLVNYAAMHLARKIVKREALEEAARSGKNPNDRLGAAVLIRDENKEMELQKKIVVANFSEETKEEGENQSKEEFVCEICGFKAKSALGLQAHMRKHK